MTALDARWLVTRRHGATGYTGGLITLSSPTNLLGAGVDDSTSAITAIGFNFRLNGVEYTHFKASSNGWMALGTSSVSCPFAYSTTNNSLANSTSSTYYSSIGVLPWWDDLETVHSSGATNSPGFVQYKSYASSSGRNLLVVEWNLFGYYNHTTTNNDTLRFQVVLWDESSSIEFRYGSLITDGTPSRTVYSSSCGIVTDTTSGLSGNVRGFLGSSASPPVSAHARGGSNASQSLLLEAKYTSGPANGDHWPGETSSRTPAWAASAIDYAYDFLLAPSHVKCNGVTYDASSSVVGVDIDDGLVMGIKPISLTEAA